jgi:hypothetical protein
MKKQTFRGFVYTGLFIILSGFTTLIIAIDKDKTFNVSKGDNLEVGVSNGNISISTWDKDQVYVKAGDVDEDDLKYLKIEQQGSKVVVEFKGQDSDDFYLEVSIPSQFNLDISTGGGNILIKANIDGKVELATGGGNIELRDVSKRLSVSTGGGNISVGSVGGETELSTGGGNISVKDVKSKIDVSTGGGNISVGNIGGSGEISTAGGNISVGKVSGSIELNTAGGNISLDGATGKVEANTAGGNISLTNISGSIEANTAGGNIYADLVPSSSSKSEFNTAGGDISLVVPSDAKVNITATVYVGKKANDPDVEKLIKSDFEPTTVDITNRNLIKKFVLNGGGSNIELNTAGGKIKISKK